MQSTKLPIVVVAVGMAGSGKTSFTTSFCDYCDGQGKRPYLINLDPASLDHPGACNIDIRDTVNYKQIMQQYKLGPNGSILTCLNLFATKFDQVLKLIESKASSIDYVIVDTPGQLEAFTSSSSGSLILGMLSSVFPTLIAYVLDTPRCSNPNNFMSNMLNACSVYYKSQLPFICVYNKADVVDPGFAMEWMSDTDKFADDADQETYMSTLMVCMGRKLEPFFRDLKCVSVSSLTETGFSELDSAVQKLRSEISLNGTDNELQKAHQQADLLRDAIDELELA